MDSMRRIVKVQLDGTFRLNLDFFRHHVENVTYSWNNCAPEVGTLYTPELESLLGQPRQSGEPLEQRHKDIASSAQAMYEEAFFALLNAVHDKYQCSTLALSGGCAMNSAANGKVYQRSPFDQMYLPAAAGDAGGAIGAAFAVWHQLNPLAPRFHMDHAYWGPNANGCESLLRAKREEIERHNCKITEIRDQDALCRTTAEAIEAGKVTEIRDQDALCRTTAEAIEAGKVVGWGRMEWGPRALGNRSILCDPRRADMKEILNLKIKRRESFRPFAPSVLRKSVADWLETEDEVPFMMQVFQLRAEKRPLVPAVTHVDGSCRLHTITQEANPLYYRLISEFCALTSVPMLLNTSFNENEPVVCRPEEALDCFLRTKMDLLVLDSFVLERKEE